MRLHALVSSVAPTSSPRMHGPNWNMSCRRVSTFASSSTFVKLTFCLLLLLTLNVSTILTDHFIDDCHLVECPNAPTCPADSYPKATSEELDDLDDYDEFAENNPFAGMHIEALLPQHDEHTDEQPQNLLWAETTTTAVKRAKRTAKAKQRVWKRDLSFLHMDMNREEELVKNCCIEYECKCKECVRSEHWPQCPPNEVAVESASAQGTPGNCCASYVCVKQWQCAADNDGDIARHSQNKDAYWKDACTRCVCFSGEELCHQLCDNSAAEHLYFHHSHHHHHHQQDEALATNCYSTYLDKLMFEGESWLEDADCSECNCIDGEKECTMSFCAAVECKNPKKIPGKCCPVCVAEEELPVVPAVDEEKMHESEEKKLPEVATTENGIELFETTTTTATKITTAVTKTTETMTTTQSTTTTTTATASPTTVQSTSSTSNATVEAATETILLSTDETTTTTTEAVGADIVNAIQKQNKGKTIAATMSTIAIMSETESTNTAVDFASTTATAKPMSESDVSLIIIATTASYEPDDFAAQKTAVTTTTITSSNEGEVGESTTAASTTSASSAATATSTTTFDLSLVDSATSIPLPTFTDSDSSAANDQTTSTISTSMATSFSSTNAPSTAAEGSSTLTSTLATSSETLAEMSTETTADPSTTFATSSFTNSETSSKASFNLDSTTSTATSIALDSATSSPVFDGSSEEADAQSSPRENIDSTTTKSKQNYTTSTTLTESITSSSNSPSYLYHSTYTTSAPFSPRGNDIFLSSAQSEADLFTYSSPSTSAPELERQQLLSSTQRPQRQHVPSYSAIYDDDTFSSSTNNYNNNNMNPVQLLNAPQNRNWFFDEQGNLTRWALGVIAFVSICFIILGMIIYYTKSKKKYCQKKLGSYSSIPISETRLITEGTDTVLTV